MIWLMLLSTWRLFVRNFRGIQNANSGPGFLSDLNYKSVIPFKGAHGLIWQILLAEAPVHFFLLFHRYNINSSVSKRNILFLPQGFRNKHFSFFLWSWRASQ